MNIAVHKGRQKMIVWKPVDANDQEQWRDTNDFYGHKAQTFMLYKGSERRTVIGKGYHYRQSHKYSIQICEMEFSFQTWASFGALLNTFDILNYSISNGSIS